MAEICTNAGGKFLIEHGVVLQKTVNKLELHVYWSENNATLLCRRKPDKTYQTGRV